MSEPVVKRRPGRPRKHPLPTPLSEQTSWGGGLEDASSAVVSPVGEQAQSLGLLPRKRGRPRKYPLPPLEPDVQAQAATVKRKPGRPPGAHGIFWERLEAHQHAGPPCPMGGGGAPACGGRRDEEFGVVEQATKFLCAARIVLNNFFLC